MKEEVRKIVREVIKEYVNGGGGFDSNNDISRFYAQPSGYSQFPHLYTDTPDMLPDSDEVNRQNEKGFTNFSDNNEIYDFPIENFQKGLKIEQEYISSKKEFLSVFDIAKIVIDNLKKNKTHYQDENTRDT